jgi:hypothetical protein
MIRSAGKFLSGFWEPESGPYALLVLLFCTAFVLSPLLSAHMVVPFVLDCAFALTIVAGAFNVSSHRSVRMIAVVLAALSIVGGRLGLSTSQRVVEVLDLALYVAMFAVFTLLMVKRFLPVGRPPAHRIAGAVTIYLLIGLMWAKLYQLVELLSPGAFRVPEGESIDHASLGYFSFVTLATLGYGDISPVNIVARDLSVLEAIIGQLYLVILISRLVSEGSSQSGKDGKCQ